MSSCSEYKQQKLNLQVKVTKLMKHCNWLIKKPARTNVCFFKSFYCCCHNQNQTKKQSKERKTSYLPTSSYKIVGKAKADGHFDLNLVLHKFSSSQLLLQSSNPGVRFEYTVPKNNVTELREPEFSWVYQPWTHCTASCGGGKLRKIWHFFKKNPAYFYMSMALEESLFSSYSRLSSEEKSHVIGTTLKLAWSLLLFST